MYKSLTRFSKKNNILLVLNKNYVKKIKHV